MISSTLSSSKKGSFPIFLIALLMGVGCLYFISLPLYFQGGDTTELVADAYSLLVPHPPGYPLWVWIQHFWIHCFPGLNVFWKASLLNSLFSLSTLFFIGYTIRKSTLKLFLILPVLAFSKPFIEAAVLPDVFSLHGLICALIGFIFFSYPRNSKPITILLPLLFAIGITHHHTIIFLAPVYISVFYSLLSEPKNLKYFLISSFAGVLLVIGTYQTLLLLHPNHFFSWGNLVEFKNIWNHFIRYDYGSFQLSPQLTKSYYLEPLKYLLSEFIFRFLGLLALITWCLIQKPLLLRDTHLRIWSLTMGFYILFFLNLNVEPKAMGAEVLERFHLMFFIQFTILCCYILKNVNFTRVQRILSICLIFFHLSTSSFQIFQIYKLHKDSTFQDYAFNLLKQSSLNPHSIVLLENDNAFFGMRYIQTVFNKYQSIPIIQVPMVFYPWYLKKIKQQTPLIQISNEERIQNTNLINMEEDLITPNLRNGFSMMVTKGFQDGNSFHVTFHGLGRSLRPGKGISYDEKSLSELIIKTRLNSVALGAQANSKTFLFSQYAYYYLSKGLSSFNKYDYQGALVNWNLALKQVPFAFPALRNLCQLQKSNDPRCSLDSLELQKRVASEYF